MTGKKKSQRERPPVDQLLHQLQERAKELQCLYRVDEALGRTKASLDEACREIVAAIPPGWQYPDICVARIVIDDKVFKSDNFVETKWGLNANIISSGVVVGHVAVFYTQEMPRWDDGPFLSEETKLIRTIADRIAVRISQQNMQSIVEQWEGRSLDHQRRDAGDWQIVLQMLKQTDRDLYVRVARKTLNHLCWSGIPQAEELLHTGASDPRQLEASMQEDWNQAYERRKVGFTPELCSAVFKMAGETLDDNVLFDLIQRWIQEDKLSFLAQVVNGNLSLADVADAIRRYHYLAEQEPEIQSPNKRGIEVSLIRRFLSDQLQYISAAKGYIQVHDFYNLLERVVFVPASHGKLGGKSAGLYLAAQILKCKAKENELLKDVKVPKTYHLTSDLLLHFMHYNNFDEVVEQKYKPIEQARFEYPHIVQTFKSARFPAEVLNGLSAALDDLGETPLIVRSSSLLEDRVGASFSGKYKSVFVANQGTKQQRLQALLDAVAEVYASTFGPDPIEYRLERGLIDFGEEMGVMIQEVVGTQVGRYFLPSFAGVAFSKNEFRWSPRISREDGLIRLVPGLGTRAVDRIGNDYPILIAPGQPGLRVNMTPEEIINYSPQKIDVIDLENNNFVTVDAAEFIKNNAREFPGIENIVSAHKDGLFRIPSGDHFDYEGSDNIVTFEGLTKRTPFISQIKAILDTLEESLGLPIDIEFASDGRNFYILQCRSQSYSETYAPAMIPIDIPPEEIVFSANRYISNGITPEITHIVYVDPQGYSQIPDRQSMIEIGRVVGRLNKTLPRRKFILMGPGRW
ncbi:MAG: PEP/pyruvate-binding domain-containing protein, partial [bacterium]|nr:PEP/pyruvate-binding domain-containing protein [bacterium]